jgi:hypothetical protein
MKTAAFCLALLCLAASASAQGSPENFHLEAGVMLWKPSPDIVITSGTLGTPVDFVNTFAVDDKWLADVRLVLKPARKHKLRFSATPIRYESTQMLTQTIRFRGQTYAVGVPTTANLKWTLVRAGYEWDPIVTESGFAGLFFDLKYNKMNAELSAPLVTQTYERKIPVPTLGGIWRGYLTKSFAITVEFTGLKFDHGDLNAKFYDLDLYGTANFGRNAGVQFGYRSVTVDYDSDTDTGNLKLKGPYLGALVRF